MSKIRYNFSVDENVLEMAKQLAEWQNRPVSNMLEYLIQQEFGKMAPVYQAGLAKAQSIYHGEDAEA